VNTLVDVTDVANMNPPPEPSLTEPSPEPSLTEPSLTEPSLTVGLLLCLVSARETGVGFINPR
jgi:hypothetical protein